MLTQIEEPGQRHAQLPRSVVLAGVGGLAHGGDNVGTFDLAPIQRFITGGKGDFGSNARRRLTRWPQPLRDQYRIGGIRGLQVPAEDSPHRVGPISRSLIVFSPLGCVKA